MEKPSKYPIAIALEYENRVNFSFNFVSKKDFVTEIIFIYIYINYIITQQIHEQNKN